MDSYDIARQEMERQGMKIIRIAAEDPEEVRIRDEAHFDSIPVDDILTIPDDADD